MELPPSVNTLYPNRDNIVNDGNTPLPIETAYFLEDAQHDKAKFNRYWFNFPPEWSTANKGESIVGVRSAHIIKRRRKMEVEIEIYKIHKKTYEFVCGGTWNDGTLKEDYITGSNHEYGCFKVIDWVSVDGDLRGFFDAVNSAFKSYIKTSTLDKFVQNDDDIQDRDIQTDGYYDKNGFHEIIYTERNKAGNQKYYFTNSKNEQDWEYTAPYMNFFKLKSWNEDFADVFNIGNGIFQNKPEKYQTWHKELIFDNIWDRQSCKIYSSIGEQALHNYIGDSDVEYSPIKYFKLNSMDQRFWIDFYSDAHYNCPTKLPPNDSFVIEMQFLQYDKMFI